MRQKNIFAVLGFAAAISALLIAVGFFKYDNDAAWDEVITHSYSAEEMQKLIFDVKSNDLSYIEFRIHYRPECIRKTYQGYYAILKQDSGERVFIFVDQNFEIYEVITVDRFMSKDEYEAFLSDKTSVTFSDVIIFDSVFIPQGISSRVVTVHIAAEGAIVLEYASIIDGECLEDPIVTSMEFLSDEDGYRITEPTTLIVPYILEIDRSE